MIGWLQMHCLIQEFTLHTNLGKGVWAIRWTWQIATGQIYDATLIIKNNGQLITDPIIGELAFWPF